jgi:hypothetical protein
LKIEDIIREFEDGEILLQKTSPLSNNLNQSRCYKNIKQTIFRQTN